MIKCTEEGGREDGVEALEKVVGESYLLLLRTSSIAQPRRASKRKKSIKTEREKR